MVKAVHEQTITLTSFYKIPKLPPSTYIVEKIESKRVLTKLQDASRALAELKGFAQSMPNQNILINTLSLQEAKDSSAIENIITTQDELFQSDVTTEKFASPAAKEVYHYAAALREGVASVKETGLLTNNLIREVQKTVEGNNAGFRTQSGTALKNEQTGKIIYTPPQEPVRIVEHMKNLEEFINNGRISELDSLLKMSIIHHHFESIHPFFDGNGRTGRIINILYLVQQKLLDTPILYLSRYINQHKQEYYNLLQAVRDKEMWEEWVLFMLDGIHQTSHQTIQLITDIKELMQQHKNIIREQLSKIYSQDLLNNLYNHPYTKVTFLENELRIHRNTAMKYLNKLVGIGILTKYKIGKENYYLNGALIDLFYSIGKRWHWNDEQHK